MLDDNRVLDDSNNGRRNPVQDAYNCFLEEYLAVQLAANSRRSESARKNDFRGQSDHSRNVRERQPNVAPLDSGVRSVGSPNIAIAAVEQRVADAGDRRAGLPVERPQGETLDARCQRLVERMGGRGATGEELRRFSSDLQVLRSRRGMPIAEVNKTLDQVERLINSRGDRPVTQDERRRIAMQIVSHAARPCDIDQGRHNTCNVTTIQERIFTRYPSKAAEMIVTAAIEQRWQAPDGKVIQLHSSTFVPGPEERHTYPPNGQRTHASQLFQVVAVNDALQRRNQPQFYRQDRTVNPGDSGERLYDVAGQAVMETRDGSTRRVASPTLTCEEISTIVTRLTGERGHFLARPGTTSGDGISTVASAEELASKIEEMKTNGNLPATILVDANHPAIGGSGLPGRNGQWHVVSVTDYDPATRRFFVSNQWGREHDGWVDRNALFNAMDTRLKRLSPQPIGERILLGVFGY